MLHHLFNRFCATFCTRQIKTGIDPHKNAVLNRTVKLAHLKNDARVICPYCSSSAHGSKAVTA